MKNDEMRSGVMTEDVRNRIGEYVSTSGLLVLHLALACVVLNVLFLCGVSALKDSWAISFVLCAFLAWIKGRKQFVRFLLAYAIILVCTAFTFSYVDSDAITVHYPCQALMVDGWNPIYQRFAKDIMAYQVDSPHWASYIAFMPKATATCGALIASTFHLFAGDAFLGYVLVFALFSTGAQFAREFWPSSCNLSRIGFAVSIVMSTQISSIITGRVDYTVYATSILAVLSGAILLKNSCKTAYAILFSALVLAGTAKPFTLAFVLLIMLTLLATGWKNRLLRYGLLVSFLAILIAGFSPVFTAWATQEQINVTEDFVTNADGAKMGWISRVCYSWISNLLAVKACALCHWSAGFSPELICLGGGSHQGFGVFFRVLVCISFAVMIFTRRNIVFGTAVFVFLATNAMPVKYIGYPRYSPQMWVFPVIVFFNFLYCHQNVTANFELIREWIARGLVGLIVMMSVAVAVRSGSMFLRALAIEYDRQQVVKGLKEGVQSHSLPKTGNKYVLARLLAKSGVRLEDGGQPLSPVESFLVFDAQDSKRRAKALDEKYPLCFSPRDFLKFDWKSALVNIPHPIFCK